MRIARQFYRQLCFEDVAVVCDLDCVFASDAKNLFSDVGIDPALCDVFRGSIGWTEPKDPPLERVLEGLREKGEPAELQATLARLEGERIFVLPRGAPEQYLANGHDLKASLKEINEEGDLLHVDYLRNLFGRLLVPA